jgi:hypothetical protein
MDNEPIKNGYGNSHIRTFGRLNVRYLKEINIFGGNCTNAISILNILMDLMGINGSSFGQTIKNVNMKGIEKDKNLEMLEEKIDDILTQNFQYFDIKFEIDYKEDEIEETIGNREDGTWAKKFLDDINRSKAGKLDWYKMIGGGIETNKKKEHKIMFKDGSGLLWDDENGDWSLY